MPHRPTSLPALHYSDSGQQRDSQAFPSQILHHYWIHITTYFHFEEMVIKCEDCGVHHRLEEVRIKELEYQQQHHQQQHSSNRSHRKATNLKEDRKRLKMLQVHCSGTPYEIGYQHGHSAAHLIRGSLSFYTWKFADSAKLTWPAVQKLALEFSPIIAQKWPAYHEEMRGLAVGAGVQLADVIALNVRTEIAFGLFSDGCTALSWRAEGASWLAQNWDWDERQKANLVNLTIEQRGKPTIKMVTEAGILGKIGLNEAGVGVCLNAIKARGMDRMRLPCHLGLRMVLESESREEAVRKLEECGIASACHMLVADPTGGVGLEWSATDLKKVEMNSKKQVFHSNHYLKAHEGVEDKNWLDDSKFRVKRIEELCKDVVGEPTFEKLFGVFKDTANAPGSICRTQDGKKSSSATLFNIIMDLEKRRAEVCLGKPTDPDERFVLSFENPKGKF